MYWRIEPYHTNEADYCVLPADTEKHHRTALNKYAIDRLEDLWDQTATGKLETLTIELCKGEMSEEMVG